MSLNHKSNLQNAARGQARHWRRQYIFVYTLAFLLCCAGVYFYFYSTGKTFIWEEDGWHQHYNALTYYARWLRSIIKNLFVNHQLVIPQWSFSLGMGSDILTTLNYYAIGDPLNLFSVLVPGKYMYLFYDGMILLRLYLSGLFFSLFCFKMQRKSRLGVLCGALTFVFCGFALFAGVRHPYFINPMLYLPLLLMGVEKLLRKERPYLLIVAVGIAGISNFYFFYMLVLMVVFYTVVRLVMIYKKDIKHALCALLQVGGYSLIGVALSAILLLPVLYVFLSDSRTAAAYLYDPLYTDAFYKDVPASMISYMSPGSWTYLCYSAISLPAVFLLYQKRHQNTALKIVLPVVFAGLLLPVVGRVFNGFSYVSNRWCFGFSFVIAFVLATMWPSLLRMNKREGLVTLGLTGVWIGLSFLADLSNNGSAVTSMIILLLSVLLLTVPAFLAKKDTKWIRIPVLVLMIAGIFFNSFWCYGPEGYAYANQFLTLEELEAKSYHTADQAILQVEEKNQSGFYRYAGSPLGYNTTLYNGTYGTQYFWSLSNHETAAARIEQNQLENMTHQYFGLDGRTALNTLASVRYYTTENKEHNALPYGYEAIKRVNVGAAEVGKKATFGKKNSRKNKKDRIITVYENQYTLPLGYTYNGYISRERYDAMTALQKQEALLQGMVPEEIPAGFQEISPKFTGKSVPFRLVPDQNAKIVGNSIVATAKKATVTLRVQGLPAGETYLCFTGLQYEGAKENSHMGLRFSSKIGTQSTTTKSMMLSTPYFSWYNNRTDFNVCFGYTAQAVTEIEITLPKAGTYRYDTLSVVCQPMTAYPDEVAALKENALENISVAEANQVTGDISLTEPKLLCLSIPYSTGWKATVDGKAAPLFRANTEYLGLALTAGTHQITLTYQTPFLRYGAAISLGGLLIFAAVILLTERRRKASSGDKKRLETEGKAE